MSPAIGHEGPLKGGTVLSSIASDSLLAASVSTQAAWQTDAEVRQEGRAVSPALCLTSSDLEIRIPIRRVEDIMNARRSGRHLAVRSGFSDSRVVLVLTAISELARNILMYARDGEIVLARTERGGLESIIVTATDEGPGIEDLPAVLEAAAIAHSCRGLNGLKACMDHFHIESRPGVGTHVTCEVSSR